MVLEYERYLKFECEGRLYRFVCYPNGLGSSLRKFTKITNGASLGTSELRFFNRFSQRGSFCDSGKKRETSDFLVEIIAYLNSSLFYWKAYILCTSK